MLIKTIICAAFSASSLVSYSPDSALKAYYDWEFHPNSSVHSVEKQEGVIMVFPDETDPGSPVHHTLYKPKKASPAWVWTDRYGVTIIGPLEDCPDECRPDFDDFIRIFTNKEKKK